VLHNHSCDLAISVLIHRLTGRDKQLTTRLQLCSLHDAKCKPSTYQLIKLMTRDYWHMVTLANHQNAHITRSSSTDLVQSQQHCFLLLPAQLPVLGILLGLHQKQDYKIHCHQWCDIT